MGTSHLVRPALRNNVILKAGNRLVIVNISQLESMMRLAKAFSPHQTTPLKPGMVINWLAIMCGLGIQFTESITEVSCLQPDATNAEALEWLVKALHVHTGTCVRLT